MDASCVSVGFYLQRVAKGKWFNLTSPYPCRFAPGIPIPGSLQPQGLANGTWQGRLYWLAHTIDKSIAPLQNNNTAERTS
jgi:hypothetical protein